IVPRRDVTVSRVVVAARRVNDDGRSWYVDHRRRRRWRVHDGGRRRRVNNCRLLHNDRLLHNHCLTEDVGGAVEDRLASGDLIEDREGAERESGVGRGAGARLLWNYQEGTCSEYH